MNDDLQAQLEEIAKNSKDVATAVFALNLSVLRRDTSDIKSSLSDYVTKASNENMERRIAMLEKIVYSAIGVILLAFLGAVIIVSGLKR